jgi:nucleoside-diphosphate-sugar epimerase
MKDLNIPEDAPVLVTGATGYLAGWIIKSLLEQGATVHATVRDPGRKEKLESLEAIAAASPGEIRFFAANLTTPGAFAEAMVGCQVVFHTASPFSIAVTDPQKDLIEPAQLGTRNVLEQAKQVESVKRVVLTSSCAAIYGDNIDLRNTANREFTEEHWNTTSSLTHQAYSYSKTLAEREAWKIAESQARWKLVVINPSLILGPAIDPQASGESMSIMMQYGDGTMKAGVPNYGMGIVDVRDVAEAHLKAGFLPHAHGRHIISAHNAGFPAIAEALRPRYGQDFPLPTKVLRKWLVWLIAPFFDKAVTRRIVYRNVNNPWVANNSKGIRELGLKYRPLEQTVCEMFQQLIDAGRVKKR